MCVLLTHWGRVTHICISKLTIISSNNGLSPGRRQAIIWTNAGKLLFGPPGTNFSEILIEIHTFSFKKMHFKMSSGKWRPFCLSLSVLTHLCIQDNLFSKAPLLCWFWEWWRELCTRLIHNVPINGFSWSWNFLLSDYLSSQLVHG